ncbi:Hypothetical predicted protein [Mytilus galloprovincialis]|uniref:Uncharacterized protein n=1 Tax=Mytilus galloprovincialis TaxID=29158 RepID=A0A8B6FY82_MYTGA|nr:Hypothetical predicted protein [Mytilus galloprovincialis]
MNKTISSLKLKLVNIMKKAALNTFDLHVAEKGALFDQSIDTDIINDIIYYHTPAHNDLDEMYKVQDFKHNIEVSCYPSKLECYKTYLDRTVYKDATETTESLVKGYKYNGNQISGEEPTSVFLKNWYKKGVILDLNLLGSKSAKEFVEGFGFQLHEVGLIPENSEILQNTNTTTGERKKRQLVSMDCANGAEPTIKYGYTNTQGCDWLYVCEPTLSNEGNGISEELELELDCPRSHVRDRVYMTCLCCPEHNTASACYCQAMNYE